MMGDSNREEATTHLGPWKGGGLMPCCGRGPFEVSRTDRMTSDPTQVTCGTPPADPTDDEREAAWEAYSVEQKVRVGQRIRPDFARHAFDAGFNAARRPTPATREEIAEALLEVDASGAGWRMWHELSEEERERWGERADRFSERFTVTTKPDTETSSP